MRLLSFFVILTMSLCGLAGLPVAGHAEVAPATVVLDKAVHFTAPGGDDVFVPAGAYGAAVEEERLRLTPHREEAVYIIQGERGSHEQMIDLPVAVTMPGEGESSDLLFIGVLLPDGSSLQTTGSFSGVRGRGFRDQAQQFQQNTRQTLRNAVQNVGARVPQVSEALCKAGLRTRPAAIPILAAAKRQADPILQDPRFKQLMQEAVQTVFREKADLIRQLVDQARFLADPRNRERLKSLLSGERICERPFNQTWAAMSQVYASMPRPRAVQVGPATPGMSYTIAASGEAEYIAGIQGAIGLVYGQSPDQAVSDGGDTARLTWALGGTIVSDIGASGGLKFGYVFGPPPQGVENRFDLVGKVGGDSAVGGGTTFQFSFDWNSIREEWKTQRLKSLVPYLGGIEIALLATASASPVTIGLDIGYSRVTRFTW